MPEEVDHGIGTHIGVSPWATVTNGIRYNSGVGINTDPDATNQLKISGNVVVSGDVSAGSVTGNLNGNVNGMTMGKIFQPGDGTITTTAGGTFQLSYDQGNDRIIINNTSTTDNCFYWYRSQRGINTEGNSGIIGKGNSLDIIPDHVNEDSNGFEIHFGMVDATTGWCSVWVQQFHGTLVGHFIKY